MIDVDNFACSPTTVGLGPTQVTLMFTGSASNDATPVIVVYSLAKDKNLFWSQAAQGTVDPSGKQLTVGTRFNILSDQFFHRAELNVGTGFTSGDQFRITLTAAEQGGASKTKRTFITFQ